VFITSDSPFFQGLIISIYMSTALRIVMPCQIVSSFTGLSRSHLGPRMFVGTLYTFNARTLPLPTLFYLLSSGNVARRNVLVAFTSQGDIKAFDKETSQGTLNGFMSF